MKKGKKQSFRTKKANFGKDGSLDPGFPFKYLSGYFDIIFSKKATALVSPTFDLYPEPAGTENGQQGLTGLSNVLTSFFSCAILRLKKLILCCGQLYSFMFH